MQNFSANKKCKLSAKNGKILQQTKTNGNFQQKMEKFYSKQKKMNFFQQEMKLFSTTTTRVLDLDT